MYGKIQKIAVVVILLLSLYPFIHISLFIFPTADDFCNALNDANKSILERFLWVYKNWSGRYTPAILGKFANIMVEFPFLYKLFAIFRFFVLLILIYLFLKKTFWLSFFNAFIYSSIFFLTFLSCMPEIGSAMYWLTSARVYTLGIILSFIYILYFISKSNQKNFIYSKIELSILAILIIFSAGCNEPITIILLIFHACIYILFKQSRNPYFHTLTIILIISSVISFLAPGNFARTAIISKPDFSYMLIDSTKYLFHYLFTWISYPFVIWGIVMFYMLGCSTKNKNFVKIPFRLFILTILCVIYAGVASSEFGVGGLSSERMINPSFFYFLLALYVYMYQLGVHTNNNKITHYYKRTMQFKYILFSMGISFYLCSPNCINLYNDFKTNKFQKFGKFVNTFPSQKGKIHNPLQTECPKTFSYFIMPSEKANWATECMEKYYLQF